MKRRSFLKIFGKGAAVVAATPVIIGGLTEVIAGGRVADKFTDQTILDAIKQIQMESLPNEYTVWTGKGGWEEMNKAMKEFAMEQENKMWYGIS